MPKYQACIDVADIVSSQIIRTENTTNIHVYDPEVKKYYVYDYYIQLNLSTVNGNSLRQLIKIDKEKRKKNKKRRKSTFDSHHFEMP